jgi:hypothetical protein
VDDLNGEKKFQMCRCTGYQRWRGGNIRNDWVWVQQSLRKIYGSFNGRLPWQLQRLFKLNVYVAEGEYVEYSLALAGKTVPENSGNLEPVSKCAKVRLSAPENEFKIFNAGNIIGCAHVIPERACTDNIQNDRWIVNSHIDLETWN